MSSAASTFAAFEDVQWLSRFALRLAHDADEAQDLVQDTLVEAWRDPPADTGRSLRPWLASVLRNRLRMTRRGRERRQRREAQAEDGREVATPDDELARLEVLSVLLSQLRELPSEDQAIVVRRFFEGQTAVEIGRALGVPAATIRSRSHRSLKRLKARLDHDFGDRKTWCAAVSSISVGGSATPVPSAASKPTMSIAAKAIIVATVTLGAGAYAYATSDSEPAAVPTPVAVPMPAAAPTPAPAAGPESKLAPAALIETPEARWKARRAKIRGTARVEPTTAAAPKIFPTRAAADYGELVRACIEDLDSRAAGALTLSIHEVGAPGVGTIYETVDVVHTNFDDEETIECLVQSMYAYVGEAPEAPLDRVVTRNIALGIAETLEPQLKQMAGYIAGAHVAEIRACQSKAEGEVVGTVAYAVTIGEGGVVEDSTPGPSALPSAVVDCVTTATKGWPFPKTLAGRTFTHAFTFPIRASR
ncbi:MAG: sigma-70 family RNA polymerase sigma factor [Deltaproteobacteria bacterium]|nr:sigma-70 family RNA polymerase sigma factor [Deltaproteobacteria bacterium]